MNEMTKLRFYKRAANPALKKFESFQTISASKGFESLKISENFNAKKKLKI